MKFNKTVYGDVGRAVVLHSFGYYREEYPQEPWLWLVVDKFWSLEKLYYGRMTRGAFFII